MYVCMNCDVYDMSVCMYVYMYVYTMCVCIYVCIYVCRYVMYVRRILNLQVFQMKSVHAI